MPKNNLFALLVLSIALSSCATTAGQHAEKSAPAAAPVVEAPAAAPTEAKAAPAPVYRTKSIEAGGGMPIAKDSHPLVPARAFCIGQEKCDRNFGAYGYLLFTRRPVSEVEKQRYLSICHAYIAAMEPTSAYSHLASTQIATTFWLLTSKPQDENSCMELIENYNYARAAQIASSIRKLGSAGPILMASRRQADAQAKNREMLVIDLGKMQDNDMNAAFAIWKDRISQDRLFWGNTFNFDLIVAEFGSLIRTYGKSIVEIIRLG